MNSILILNLFSSFFLCGLIWTVQLVHYPFFLFADSDRFKPSMDFHRSRISFIVIPVMLAELFSSAWLTFYSTDFTGFHTTGLLLILLVWAVTFFRQVPLHSRLSSGFDANTIQKLVFTNWARTILWSLKSILGILILREYLI